jgi:cbb3-type cytochrome oxidase subunit 3
MFTPHGTFSPAQLIPFIFILPLIAFWAWMFRDMANNDRLPSSAKDNWTLAFILGNVFAAVVYYATEYRGRR